MKLDRVYEYVKDFFQRNFLEAYLIFEGHMDYIEKQYIVFYEENISDKFDSLEIKKGACDKELDNLLKGFVNQYFTLKQQKDIVFLNNYVMDLLVKRGVNVNFSNDIFEHITKLVSSRIWSQYDSSRIGQEDFDHVINLVYNNICNQYAKMIDRKIESILDNRYDFFELRKSGLDKQELKKYVISNIFMKENKLFLNKLRMLVISPDKNLSQVGLDLNKYINQYFSNYSDSYVDDKQVVLTDSKDNFGKKNVRRSTTDGVYENNGEAKFVREMMKKNSVRDETLPFKFKMNEKQIKIAKTVLTLALLGTLVGVAVGVNHCNENRLVEDAIARAEAISSFDYNRRTGRTDGFFNEMSFNVLSVYSKLMQLEEENYKNIGLYFAYDGSLEVNKNVMASLSEMEKFFESLKKNTVKEDINIGLRNNIKADSNEEYFYLDFVYDTLLDAGYYDLSKDEYQKVLLRYKYAKFGTRFGVVVGDLSSSEIKLIENVMTAYAEFCKNAKIDIGNLMINGEYTFFDTYNKSTGKGM